MPKTMTAQAAPTAATAVFTDETLRKAAGLVADHYRPLWTGPSGEESSGEAVAVHLEAAIALLDKDGWTRTHDHSKAWSTGASISDDDFRTVESMLKALLLQMRDEIDNDPQRTLSTALHHVGAGGGQGDPDTASISSDVLDMVVRAHTGTDSARATAWSERLARTYADITALLNAGARFARAYGPGTTKTQEQAA